jgi:hypothetical protein
MASVQTLCYLDKGLKHPCMLVHKGVPELTPYRYQAMTVGVYACVYICVYFCVYIYMYISNKKILQLNIFTEPLSPQQPLWGLCQLPATVVGFQESHGCVMLAEPWFWKGAPWWAPTTRRRGQRPSACLPAAP